MQSTKGIALNAGTGRALQSQPDLPLKAGGAALVETGNILNLKGTQLRLNGGTKPLATAGSQVQMPG